MSLQVWLPLNGDLHNQGLSDITVTNSGATVNNNGKIGQCYSFAKNAYINIPASAMTSFTNECSVSLWVKINSWNTNWDTIFQAGTGSTPWTAYTFGLLRNQADYLCACISNGSSYTASSCKTGNLTIGTWHHIVMTYKTGHVCAYLDGVLSQDYSTSIVPNFSGITSIKLGGLASTYKCDCLLNDVRIYDHALSAKEVEEIAKGLVLHYKLDDIYSESTTNLITTVDGLSNTCYNGAINKYNYGTTTDMYKTTGTFQGKFCTKVYMGTAGNNAYPYIYFDPFNAKGTEIQTVSFDYYPTIQNTLIPYSYNGTYNFNYTSDGVSGSATNVSQIIIPVNVGQWNHITITAQKYDTTNTSRGIGYVRIGSAAHTSTTTDYWLFANVQVEAKDHATGYAGVGGSRVATTIYDSSGYGNNGIIAGNLTTDNNSIRYGATTVFPSGGYIRVENRPAACLPKEALTVNLWQYSTSWSNPISCTEGGGWNFENSSGIRFPVYISGVGYKVAQSSITPASLNNAWHMLTGTMDKDNIKIYIDGEEAGTVAKGSTNGIGYANNYLFISAEASGNSVTPANSNYTGKLSDIRIYATALTPEQIKELYNTSMSIDDKGNIHARELVEL